MHRFIFTQTLALNVVCRMADEYGEQFLSVLPNPSSGTFQLMMSDHLFKECIVSVYNCLEEFIEQFEMAGSVKYEIGESYGAGLYLLKIQTEGSEGYKKLIKL